MKLIRSKKGKLSTSMLNTAILAIVLLVVLFQLYAALLPEAQTAGNSLNDSNYCVSQGCVYDGSGASTAFCVNGSGVSNISCASSASVPLGGLFSGTGVIFVIIMAALLILVVKSFMPGKK